MHKSEMLLDFNLAFSVSLIVVSLSLTIIWYYKKRISLYSEFPSVNFLPMAFKFTLMFRIPKNVPATSFFFQYWIDTCKRFQSEGLCLFWILQPYLLIFNEDAYKFFGNDHESIDKPFDFRIFKEFWGTSLLTASGNSWRKRRKILNPLFYKSMLKDKASMMNKNAKVLIKQLMEQSHEESVVIIRYLKLCAFMNVYEYLSGLDFNKEENHFKAEDFIDCVTKSTEMATYRILQPWFHPQFTMVTFKKGRTFLKRLKEGHLATIEFVKNMKNSDLFNETGEKEKTDDDHKVTRVTFVDLLKQHFLKDSPFTFQDVKDEFTGLVTAGYDTVSYALMWSLFLLGHHPEEQERLFEEVDSMMEASDNLSSDDLQNMKYLECVIKETLRIYPPIPIFARYLSKDVQYGKYSVPKGTNIMFFLYLSGRDPKMFPDPEKFDPERFLERKTLLTWTFAEGARNCIGKHFALLEMKIVLAHIIKNFKVTSLDRPEDIHLSWEVVLTTVEPLRMRFTPRCQVPMEE